MKVVKGKLKLSKTDTRVGNFVLSQETDHIKICDINNYWNMRFNVHTDMGRLFKEIALVKDYERLEMFIKMYFAITTILPDQPMLQDFLDIYNRRVERLQATTKVITEEKDQKILEEEKELYEAIQTLKEEDV